MSNLARRTDDRHPKRWWNSYTRTRLLCRLKCPDGQYIQEYGWRYDPIPQRRNELDDPESHPLVLDNQSIDVMTHEIVSTIHVWEGF